MGDIIQGGQYLRKYGISATYLNKYLRVKARRNEIKT